MRERKTRYSHVFTIAFYVKSDDHQGEDVTGEMIREALLERLKCSDDELEEACGAPDQTEPLDQD